MICSHLTFSDQGTMVNARAVLLVTIALQFVQEDNEDNDKGHPVRPGSITKMGT